MAWGDERSDLACGKWEASEGGLVKAGSVSDGRRAFVARMWLKASEGRRRRGLPSLSPHAGCGLEFLLVLCGLELSWSCPRHCICYTGPSTVSCQAHNFLSVPEGIPPDSERIFLQNNKIHRLLRGHFSPTTVTLWIYSNNITYIEPSTFHGFTLLEELDLGDNRHLRSLAADTFHGLGRLHALHLYHCGLSALPGNIFQGLRNLQYLYLQDNHLKFLQDDTFGDLHNLSHLFLHGNRLWSLHQNTFRGLRALDRLLLHQNQLQWIDRLAFHDLKRLTTLYLFNNSLVELSGQCLDMLPALEYLRLNDNPWACDCKAVSLWEWLKRFRGSTSSVGCQAPPDLVGKDLKLLRKEDFPNCSPLVPNSESRAQSKTNNLSGTVNPSMNGSVGSVGSGGQSRTVHPLRPGRSRNCTKPRVRGSKGKADNEVHHSKEVMTDKENSSPDFTDGGKYDHTSPDGTITRRKHKCTPRTTVRPPSGVQQANNRATLPQSLLYLHTLLGTTMAIYFDFIVR
ncbi:reticulon-4 receptor-like 1b [Lampris incognitus]|uniref:reticulon-4 receptor-like 1b n=1 Tax=Lampris incognitus TaxID=2546036 RepID=UPI0024B5D7DD|nr:reticulon-4 receptor-like 1b [Lampris incognitus]